jgi:hypothetical protein
LKIWLLEFLLEIAEGNIVVADEASILFAQRMHCILEPLFYFPDCVGLLECPVD